MTKTTITLLLAFLALVLGGCNSASLAEPMTPATVAAPPALDAMKAGIAGAEDEAGGDGRSAQAEPEPLPEPNKTDGTTGPLLIYTANYTMSVFEVAKSLDKVHALAKDLGGYLVQRNDQSITIRVPADKYRGALGDISKIGDVLHHEESVEDVTEQYHDLMTRLTNARALRGRLQELLAAAKNVTEALEVERELARVTQDIELLEGKLKRMRELLSFSTITVTFAARGTEQVNSNVELPFPWLSQLGLGPLMQLQ